MGPAARDLVNGAGYLAAAGAMLAAAAVGSGMLLRATPGLMRTWMPATETTGSGASVDAAYRPWRLSPQEAQSRFDTRSSVLLPPTPAYPAPDNGWPSYGAVARKRAVESATAAALARRPTAQAVIGAPRPSASAPATPVDFQMNGR